jgi:hypothetical protein
MMAFVRLLVPFGLMGFGAVAAFMGFVVLINSASTGRVSYSYVADNKPVTRTITKNEDADAYWRTLGLAGGLPALLGIGAMWFGRRMLHR